MDSTHKFLKKHLQNIQNTILLDYRNGFLEGSEKSAKTNGSNRISSRKILRQNKFNT